MNKTRTEYIMVTMTKAEKDSIKAQAAVADMPVTMYCRRVLLAEVKREESNEQFRTI